MERIITKSFARLMGRGIHRGFITHEELSKSLGKRNLSGDNLAQAFIHILNEKIVIVQKKSDFKVLRKKENTSKEEGKTVGPIALMLIPLLPHSQAKALTIPSKPDLEAQ